MKLSDRTQPSLAPYARFAASWDHGHLVEFYETEEFLVDTVSAFVAPALQDGDAAIVVATAAHRGGFEASLRAAGIDVSAAVTTGRYLVLDAAELLASFMVGGVLDADRFGDTVGALIERAAGAGRRVRIYGEMVALLWEARDVASVITLEDLWNDLAAAHEFTLLCAYPMHAFEDEAGAAAFRQICKQHTTVIPGEEYGLLDRADEQRRTVALLQQERAALRAEVARLRAEQKVLAELAYVDALTGVANRRAFDTHLGREWALSMRDEVDSFVLVADLDGFKAFNDAHGHAAGDEALRQFAGALAVAARSTDILGRIGGDEFAILLVRCPENAVQRFEDRVREAMVDVARPRIWWGST